MTPRIRTHRRSRPKNIYLAAPWIVLAIVALGLLTGLADQIAAVVPYGMGKPALDRAWIGMAVLFVACSFFWAYADQRSRGKKGVDSIVDAMAVGLTLSLAQLCILGGLYLCR